MTEVCSRVRSLVPAWEAFFPLPSSVVGYRCCLDFSASQRIFHKYDTDGDGVLSVNELSRVSFFKQEIGGGGGGGGEVGSTKDHFLLFVQGKCI
jgi:hypothetical protein